MLTNFWKIAIRQLMRNKSFSLLNIAGLTLGMAGALLIFCWIAQEISYDRWEPNQGRLYQFGDEDPMGKIVAVDGQLNREVTDGRE